jgi:hypothetical protein
VGCGVGEDWNSDSQLDVAAANGLLEVVELAAAGIAAWLLLLIKALQWPLKADLVSSTGEDGLSVV